MAAPVEFAIKILGGAAAELGKTSDGFEKTEKSAKKSADGVKAFDAESGKLKDTIGGLTINLNAMRDGGAVFTFDLAAGLRAGFEAAEALVGKIVDISKEVVKTVAKVEDLNFALKSDLGEEGSAQLDKLAESFERTNKRISKSQFKAAVLPLAEQGITDMNLIDKLATTAADVAARKNTGQEGFKSYLGALSDIALKGGAKIKGQLKELGIKPTEYYTALGGLLHTSAKEAEGLAKAGKVANETMLSTAIHMVAVRENGKGLGAAGMESAQTLGGTLDRLANLPENLISRLMGTEGMKQVQRVINSVLDRLEGPDGIAMVERFGSALGDAFENVTAEDVVTVVHDIAEVVSGIVKGLSYAIQLYAAYSHARDATDDAHVGVKGRVDAGNGKQILLDEKDRDAALDRAGVGGWSRAWSKTKNAALNVATLGLVGSSDLAEQASAQVAKEESARAAKENSYQLGAEVGRNYGAGLGAGLSDSKPFTEQAAAELAQAVHRAASGPQGFDAHSPSRKGIALGRFYAMGIGEGMESESKGLAISATRTIAQTVDVRGGGPAQSSGRSAPTSIVINVNESHTPRETAQEIRAELARLMFETEQSLGVAA